MQWINHISVAIMMIAVVYLAYHEQEFKALVLPKAIKTFLTALSTLFGLVILADIFSLTSWVEDPFFTYFSFPLLAILFSTQAYFVFQAVQKEKAKNREFLKNGNST